MSTETTTEPTKVTAPRVERIEGILKGDPVLKEKLTDKEPVKTRDGRPKSFHKESVRVVEAIHAAGHDAYTIGKTEVLKIARGLLDGAAVAEGSDAVAAAPSTKPAEVAATTPAGLPAAEVTGRKHLICAVNLLLGAMSVAEKHDTGDGHEKRSKALGEVVDAYTKAYQGVK